MKEGVNYTQIWRTIVNGYPYKSPKEMGVDTKEEAYFVTKQAIYCVMLKRSMTLYRGVTERGKKIVKAIERLYIIGREGGQNPEDVRLRIVKKGGFEKEGAYYYQTYAVTAEVDVSQYEVKIEGAEKGGIFVADNTGKAKNKFTISENFRVMIPKTQIDRKTELNLIVDAKCKTYPVFYGVTTVKDTQDYALTYGDFGDFSKEAKLIVNLNTGELQIQKINAETKQPIAGVTFELFNEKEESVAIDTTDEKGMVFFENLYPGNYYVREIATGEGLTLNTERIPIIVEYDKITTKTITNDYKKGSLKVIKTDEETAKSIAGVHFDLLDLDGNIVQTGVTNEQGEIFFQDLIVGKYLLKEKETNEDYIVKIEAVNVEIEHNQTTIQEIKNEKKKGNLQIRKVDKENHKIPLSDITFELYSKELEKVIGTYITDKEGKIYVENLRIGEYELREITTKEGYEIGENVNISIQEEKTTNIIVENKKIPQEPPAIPKKEVKIPKKLPKTGF